MSTRKAVLGPLGPSALAGLALLSGACAEVECTSAPGDEPTPALECESGALCYRGACLTACSAGRERTESCASSEDCSGARPRCVDGFCSACAEGERCIPLRNVCQPVIDIPAPPEPEPDPDRPLPPQPRDAGMLDDGARLDRDAGRAPPAPPRPVTHVVFADVGQTVDVIANTTGSTAAVRAYDVRGSRPGRAWRPDVAPLAHERPVRQGEICALNQLVTSTVARPASFGSISLGDAEMTEAFPGPDVQASWDPGTSAYRLSPSPLPAQLLDLSDFETRDSTFVALSGDGVEGLTDGSWPAGEQALHVPFDLRPEPDTRRRLASVLEVGPQPSAPLVFRWVRIETGVVATERVVVRLQGQGHEIRCRRLEGPDVPGEIVVPSSLLAEFVRREAPAPGAVYPVVFERAGAEQIQVDPAPMAEARLRHFVSVRVRHSFVGRARF